MTIQLIRKNDKDGMQIQELLEQLGIQYEVIIVSTGKTPEIVLEDDTR